ncbi:BnaC09g51530D [Brassica napus]|uniref:BnaC09g51530D protein n=1 Tax=Brassica napus TaxID=3708 RepID=A0A078IW09_BRANA|nr:BnaC09g51530D [Brassica napus]
MGRLQNHDFHPFIDRLGVRITTTVPLVLKKPDNDIQVGAGWTFIKG